MHWRWVVASAWIVGAVFAYVFAPGLSTLASANVDFLIPKHALNEFRQQRRFTTQAIQRFAAQLGISPGIVVGRLQHEQLLPRTHLNALKRNFCFKEEAA